MRILMIMVLLVAGAAYAEEDSAAANIGAANQSQGSTAAR